MEKRFPPLPRCLTKRDSDVQAGKLKEAHREAAQFKLVLDAFRSSSLATGMQMLFYEISLFIANSVSTLTMHLLAVE